MEQKRLVNLVLWPVALLVLNSLWMSVAGGVAPYEINDVDQDIETRTVELESVFGLTKEMPAEMEVDFTGVSVDDGTVSWTIRDATGTVIAQWTGLLSEGPPNWTKGSLPNRCSKSSRLNPTDSRGTSSSQSPFSSSLSEKCLSDKKQRRTWPHV